MAHGTVSAFIIGKMEREWMNIIISERLLEETLILQIQVFLMTAMQNFNVNLILKYYLIRLWREEHLIIMKMVKFQANQFIWKEIWKGFKQAIMKTVN